MKERYRLVAYIYPETTSWGIQLDESKFPIIAREDQKDDPNYKITVKEVWHPADEPAGWMVYSSNLYFPEGSSLENWIELRDNLDHALSLPVMHRNDFTRIFED